MTNLLFGSITQSDSAVTLSTLLIALGASFVLGMLISFSYIKTQKDSSPSKAFSLTLVILPVVITVIIMLIGGNIASAFSMAGAFSIIRFRSAPGTPKDITYVLFTMAVGLACGLGYIGYAVITAALLCLIIALLEIIHFGDTKTTNEILKITIPENLDYKNAFESVMIKHARTHKLLKIRMTELGSLYELVYAIAIKDDADEKAFIDELRCRNGNLNITLILAPEPNEF